MKPLAIDLCCGLGGWTEALIAEGWDVIGYDIMEHNYGEGRSYPSRLIIQDVLTLNGAQFRGKASLIVSSPPCTEFSYMAMPWSRGKQISDALLGEGEFPEGYKGSRTIAELTALFDACVRIGLEAGCPTVIENVRGAQRWVGRAKWNFGSFYLWGDVPALMPDARGAKGFAGFKAFKDFHDCEAARKWSSKDPRRKQWSAEIAKIPGPLASWIAHCFRPIP